MVLINSANSIPDKPDELETKLSKPNQIYELLKRNILDGTLPVGTHLTETEICQQYNISRTPVHQAVVQLELEHLVRTLPKRGLVVLEINPRDFINLYDVAEALESMAARLAANSCTAYHLHMLEQYSKSRDSHEAIIEQYDFNYLFHMTVAEASGNEILYGYIKSVRERLSLVRFCKKLPRKRPQENRAGCDHAHILDAIRRHDADEAEALMRAHINSSSRSFFEGLSF